MRQILTWFQARPDESALLAALLLAYPLSAILPPAWASEGNILESMQVVVLLGGFVLAMLAFVRARPARIAMLALWVAPVWLLLAGRELSWGRAWLAQAGVDSTNLAPFTTPAAVVLLGWLAFSAWRHRVDAPVRSAFARRTPWLCFGVMLAAAMGSTCAEGHMSCDLPLAAPTAQVFEELAELVAYLALCTVQNVVFMHHAGFGFCRGYAHAAEAEPEEAG